MKLSTYILLNYKLYLNAFMQFTCISYQWKSTWLVGHCVQLGFEEVCYCLENILHKKIQMFFTCFEKPSDYLFLEMNEP